MGDALNYVLAAMAGLFLYAGIFHFLSERELPNRLFGVLCWLAAGYCIANLVALKAGTSAELVAAVRWRAASIMLLYVTLLWFMKAFTQAIPGTLAFVVTGLYAVLLAANGILPLGISFSAMPAMPDTIAMANSAGAFGGVPFWIPVLWLAHMIVLGLCLNACRIGFRGGQRSEAIAIGSVLGIVMLAMVLALFEDLLIPPDSTLEIRRLIEAARLGLVVTISLVLRRRIAIHNSHLKALVDHVPAYVFMKDLAGRYVFVNRHWLDQFRRTIQDSLGKTDLELFPREIAATYRENDQRVLKTGQLLEFEEASSPEAAGARIYSSLKFPVRGSDGQPQLLGGISTDVTEFARLQEALQISESRLRQALTAAKIAIWEWDLASGAMSWSDNAPLVFGRSSESMPGNIGLAMNLVMPEDRSAVADRIESARLRENGNYLAEFRVPTESGSIVWLESRGSFDRNERGEAVCMRGTVTDISERKRAERAEIESQQRYRQLAAATFEGIAITENGVLLDANEQLVEMFGYRREEVLGRHLAIGIAPESLEKARQMIESGAEGPYEVTGLRRDGSRFDVEVRARLFSSGDRRLRISAYRDITLRKQAEASLRLAQATELRICEEFAQHLLAAQEQERKRIANDLHDSLGQSLSLIKNRASMALEAEQYAASAGHLRSIVDLTVTSIAELRSLVHSLRPVHIEQLGLTQSLRGLLDLASQSTPIRIDVHLEDVDDLFPGERSTHVYRIVQEALANLIKHSAATTASVAIERDIHCVRLRIADDGHGFETEGLAAKGLGLTSIVERAHMLGGRFRLESAPAQGTRIVIEFPLAEASSPTQATG